MVRRETLLSLTHPRSSKVRQDHTTTQKSQKAPSEGWIVVNMTTGDRIKQIFRMKSTTTDDLYKSPKTVIFRAILKSLRMYTEHVLTRQSQRHCSQNNSSILRQDLLTYWQKILLNSDYVFVIYAT